MYKFVIVDDEDFIRSSDEMTGERFVDYITRLRMEKAKVLLKQGDLMVYEICKRVGYQNIQKG